VLDSLANFKPRRDATIALSHTWTGVTPGRHVVEAYLATSQHAQFASAQPVKVAITVRPGSATSPTAPTKPGVVSAPRSGGAAGVSRDVYPPALTLIGALAMLLGLLVLAGQLLHKSTGRRVP
jgi:hypothetical protein